MAHTIERSTLAAVVVRDVSRRFLLRVRLLGPDGALALLPEYPPEGPNRQPGWPSRWPNREAVEIQTASLS